MEKSFKICQTILGINDEQEWKKEFRNMTTFDIVISVITAIGSLATAFTFIYMLISQKGTQKQIESLAKMAEMQARQYQIARLQAGSELCPKIQISLGNDQMYGLKIIVKNIAYPIDVYKIVVKSKSVYCDIRINHLENYIRIEQNQERVIVPGKTVGFFMEYNPSVRLFMITPFDEAYEVRFTYSDENNTYQSEAIPVFHSLMDTSEETNPITTKFITLHGAVIDRVKEFAPDLAEFFTE